MQVTPLSRAFGTTLLDESGSDVLSLPVEQIVEHYKRSGAVLLRGFQLDAERFGVLTRALATDFVVNGGATRETVSQDGRTQTVNAGNHLIALHSEMGYSPFRPDIAFFYCETAPARGGETMVADGVELWDVMAEPTRKLFEERKVKYVFDGVSPEPLAQLFFGGRSIDQVEDELARLPSVSLRKNEDGTLRIENVVHAWTRPKHVDARAFANSVVVEDKRTFFEDGEPISRDLRLYLFQLGSERALMHRWRDGDVLIVDNHRLMHGRAPFVQGTERRIMIRMGREIF